LIEGNEQRNSGEVKKEAEYNTEANDSMHGYLTKSSMKLGGEQGDDIFGTVFNTIGSSMKSGFKLITETIHIKQKKMYYAIKGEILYWFTNERAREA
jgi:hypothetical protein